MDSEASCNNAIQSLNRKVKIDGGLRPLNVSFYKPKQKRSIRGLSLDESTPMSSLNTRPFHAYTQSTYMPSHHYPLVSPSFPSQPYPMYIPHGAAYPHLPHHHASAMPVIYNNNNIPTTPFVASVAASGSVPPAVPSPALVAEAVSGTTSPPSGAPSSVPAVRQETGPPGANIFVYYLPYDLTNADLYTIFEPYGVILSAKVFVEPRTQLSKGFGFVSYAAPEHAESAILSLNGFRIGNKTLKVQLKKENGSRPTTGSGGSSSGMMEGR
jgi:hypothetical protein